MSNIDYIKSKIKQLYEQSPSIHISVSKSHPRVVVEGSPAKIVGVYKNIFQVEECDGGKLPARHTFQYGDILIGQVVIAELDYAVPLTPLNKK